MPRESRTYRRRSRSRSRSPKRRSRSRERKRQRSRSRDRTRRSRSRERKRSRSREHKRSRSRERRRSRSRDRRRSRSRDRKRSRSKEREKKDKHEKSPTREADEKEPSRSLIHIEGAILVKDEPLDKEAEQKRLEHEMQKRRERIESWRSERKNAKAGQPIIIPPIPSKKKWSLEDDSGDEDEEDKNENEEDGEKKPEEKMEEEEDVDPLDAYMMSVNDEVGSTRNKDPVPTKPKGDAENPAKEKTQITMVTAVAKKQPAEDLVKKGELMEANADAMEYSSEEEEEGLDDTMARLSKNKKKDLEATDHERIYYRPFKKEFYVEVPEIARMTTEDVIAFRIELEGIKVRGKGCPKPIKTWAQCGVSKKIMDCLKRNNFDKPTPIQSQAIPAIMMGRNLIGIAKTGSGKTLAFLIPMFRHIVDQPELEEDDGPIAIVLTPTRELAMQIVKDARRFTKALNLNVVCVYGGTGISEQISELKRGAEIIVCTPGRMIDMLSANSGRVTNLRRCTYIVLDEADRMFDMGFEPQVMKIIDNVRPDRQTVMFSATFPRQMEALARKILQKPVEVQVGGRSVVCPDVKQGIVVLTDDEKFFKLLELLGVYQEQGSVLVFVDKQEHADDVMKDLMKHSYPCLALHGGIDQYDRDSIINDFKASNIKLLVATSVAARGLDVKDLILVINYDCPNHYEDYVHRCGRTGRAGRMGYAYTFLTHEQGKLAGEIIRALEASGANIPPDLQVLWDGYVREMEAEGKKVYRGSSSGFRGKGFKFDETEALLANDRKKLQKAALGLNDSDDEDATGNIEEHIEQLFASKKRVTDVSQPMIAHLQQQAETNKSNTNSDKMAEVLRLASRITQAKNIGVEAKDMTQQAAISNIIRGSVVTPIISPKTIADQMAEKINAKLGYRPVQEEEEKPEAKADTFKRWEEELEINDFPQTARWKVTSKEALATICEYSEAGITVRGTYVNPGKEPAEGERKLYLAIESATELGIQKAKTEIIRLIKEELIRLQNSYQPSMNRNRYKVLS